MQNLKFAAKVFDKLDPKSDGAGAGMSDGGIAHGEFRWLDVRQRGQFGVAMHQDAVVVVGVTEGRAR